MVELRTKDSQESLLEVLWNPSDTVDVNVFKPVATVCDVGAPKQEHVLSCWVFNVNEVRKLQHEDQDLAFLWADLGPNTLKSIQIHYNYFDLSMITITLQLQDL